MRMFDPAKQVFDPGKISLTPDAMEYFKGGREEELHQALHLHTSITGDCLTQRIHALVCLWDNKDIYTEAKLTDDLKATFFSCQSLEPDGLIPKYGKTFVNVCGIDRMPSVIHEQWSDKEYLRSMSKTEGLHTEKNPRITPYHLSLIAQAATTCEGGDSAFVLSRVDSLIKEIKLLWRERAEYKQELNKIKHSEKGN